MINHVWLFLSFCVFYNYAKIEYRHHDNEELYKILVTINNKCASVTHLYHLKADDIDTTLHNNRLHVIAFGKYATRHTPGIPEFKYVGNIHANEVIGRVMLILLADYLCDGFLAGNKKIMDLVDRTRIHILPSMNPDGWAIANSNKENRLSWYKNANNVDLNENFPDLIKVAFKNALNGGPQDHLKLNITDKTKFERETLMILNWIHSIPFVLSAHFHGHDLVVSYPYDWTVVDGVKAYTPTPDDALFIELSLAYSKYNYRMYNEIKSCDLTANMSKNGIVNGASFYPSPAGMQDYNYLATNCFEVIIVIDCDSFPDESRIKDYWRENTRSLVNYIQMVHIGIKGIVRGNNNGEILPLADATIKVRNITDDGKVIPILHNIKTDKGGDYYRLLIAGNYSVIASAPGFVSQMKCVKVTNSNPWSAKIVDFKLIKIDYNNGDNESYDPGEKSCYRY